MQVGQARVGPVKTGFHPSAKDKQRCRRPVIGAAAGILGNTAAKLTEGQQKNTVEVSWAFRSATKEAVAMFRSFISRSWEGIWLAWVSKPPCDT